MTRKRPEFKRGGDDVYQEVPDPDRFFRSHLDERLSVLSNIHDSLDTNERDDVDKEAEATLVWATWAAVQEVLLDYWRQEMAQLEAQAVDYAFYRLPGVSDEYLLNTSAFTALFKNMSRNDIGRILRLHGYAKRVTRLLGDDYPSIYTKSEVVVPDFEKRKMSVTKSRSTKFFSFQLALIFVEEALFHAYSEQIEIEEETETLKKVKLTVFSESFRQFFTEVVGVNDVDE